jgi:hypothetical protein
VSLPFYALWIIKQRSCLAFSKSWHKVCVYIQSIYPSWVAYMLLTKSFLPPHGIWLSHPFSIVQEIKCKIRNFCVGNLSCKRKQIIECWKLLVHKNNAIQEKRKDAICHSLFSSLNLASQMDFLVHMIQL